MSGSTQALFEPLTLSAPRRDDFVRRGRWKDDDLRHEYVARLTSDLESDRNALRDRVTFYTAVRSFGVETLDWLRSDDPADEEVMLAAYFAAELFFFEPIRTTYSDLLSTGNISLLDDLDLRGQLSNYYSGADERAGGWTLPRGYRVIVRSSIPPRLQDRIRELCPTQQGADGAPTGFPPCTIPDLSEQELRETMAYLKGAPASASELAYLLSEMSVAVVLFNDQAESAGGVIAHCSGTHWHTPRYGAGLDPPSGERLVAGPQQRPSVD